MSLHLIFGPMFSGKTSELFRLVKRLAAAKKSCLVVRYAKDDRYSDSHAATHDKTMLRAVKANIILNDILNTMLGYDVIAIDEGQFYVDLVETVRLLVSNGKTVLISALDGDFQQKPFGHTLELVPLSDTLVKLRAICPLCNGEASFTRRLDTTDERQEKIGGADEYAASCRACLGRTLLRASVDAQQQSMKMLDPQRDNGTEI